MDAALVYDLMKDIADHIENLNLPHIYTFVNGADDEENPRYPKLLIKFNTANKVFANDLTGIDIFVNLFDNTFTATTRVSSTTRPKYIIDLADPAYLDHFTKWVVDVVIDCLQTIILNGQNHVRNLLRKVQEHDHALDEFVKFKASKLGECDGVGKHR